MITRICKIGDIEIRLAEADGIPGAEAGGEADFRAFLDIYHNDDGKVASFRVYDDDEDPDSGIAEMVSLKARTIPQWTPRLFEEANKNLDYAQTASTHLAH